jgi:hypothetical protein
MLRALQFIVTDARVTAGRMIGDARHLRELGKRTVTGVRMAGAKARADIDRGLEHVADAILDLEARFQGGRRE